MNSKQFSRLVELDKVKDALTAMQKHIKAGDAASINAARSFLEVWNKLAPITYHIPQPCVILTDPADIMMWQGLRLMLKEKNVTFQSKEGILETNSILRKAMEIGDWSRVDEVIHILDNQAHNGERYLK